MKIKQLTLQTTRLEGQVDFYANTLGLPIIKKTEEKALFQVGNTTLIFEEKESSKPYHFAINIPSNQAVAALKWLRDRVPVLEAEGVYIHSFDSWNAEAVYFYDADQNIVELIARKTLENPSNELFDSDSLLEISEIGLPTTNIEQVYKMIGQKSTLPIYSGSFERFCSIGDEHGLFICIDTQKKRLLVSYQRYALSCSV